MHLIDLEGLRHDLEMHKESNPEDEYEKGYNEGLSDAICSASAMPVCCHAERSAPEMVYHPDEVLIYSENYMDYVTIMVGRQTIPLDRLMWHAEASECSGGEDIFRFLSLDEIASQLARISHIYSSTIMVIVEGPLDGTIYRYGNSGDYWEIVGRLCGYA